MIWPVCTEVDSLASLMETGPAPDSPPSVETAVSLGAHGGFYGFSQQSPWGPRAGLTSHSTQGSGVQGGVESWPAHSGVAPPPL